ncbi:nitrate reductase molybdenum cofactor assembly chaperone [Actinobacillus delphinicola]|uniref:nitrate reductase molybdenum cofactor assembly chaperone n=1 Tax=Actinobacillus delphinicola TaxID=51161 RepID=UPI002442BB80|nr:nitrate reductase molybdenum cofactor assembly chaperone [Actinobacillus delphinicola]
MIKILTVFSRLLDYPTVALVEHKNEICEAIKVSPYLPPELREKLVEEVEWALSQDLYEQEMRYDGLFDRGRMTSLLLFEHIHGESRDRGQAMVDLLNLYFDAGMQPRKDELPDYLPLFLEFLATRDDEVARDLLFDVSEILQLLYLRLQKKQAWEAMIFEALLIIAGAPVGDETLATKVQQELDDASLDALDIAWEDKEIRFDNQLDNACPKTFVQAAKNLSDVPIHWHGNRS